MDSTKTSLSFLSLLHCLGILVLSISIIFIHSTDVLAAGVINNHEPDKAAQASISGEPDFFITEALAASMADSHAERVWKSPIARGQPFVVYQEDGTAFAYVFPYALNASEFPSYESILTAVRAIGEKHAIQDKRFYNSLEDTIGSFGCIEVSTTRSNFPVLVVRHSLHPYFLYSEKAADIAKRRLNTLDVELKNVEFNGPHELYFNFNSPNGRIKLHAFLLKTKEELHPLSMQSLSSPKTSDYENEIIVHRRAQAWAELDTNTIQALSQTSKWIDHYTLIPVVNWTHWCVPTSMTMTAGFWDHYDPRQGTWANWGKIIDYWFDHGPVCQNNNVTNVPNLIDEMITHDTCSWSKDGFLGSLNRINGYSSSWTDTKGTAGNDWNWPLIVSEVHNDRPVVWGVGPKKPHAMTAFGYRISGSQKFVVVYNTWGSTAKQQLAEYNYDQWSGAPNTQTGVGVLLPGGGSGGNHAILVSPRGGETVKGQTKITWFVWGSTIKYTIISFSHNGGKSWNAVHKEWLLPTNAGWNSYTAALNTLTSKARIRINCYASSLKHIAGDSSVKNFFVQGKADLIPLPACKTDGSGHLVISVKNQGPVPAGATTTRVEFAPGGNFDLSFPEIDAGATAQVPLPIPGSCWNPDCNYQIKADIKNQVDEANETNNAAPGACVG